MNGTMEYITRSSASESSQGTLGPTKTALRNTFGPIASIDCAKSFWIVELGRTKGIKKGGKDLLTRTKGCRRLHFTGLDGQNFSTLCGTEEFPKRNIAVTREKEGRVWTWASTFPPCSSLLWSDRGDGEDCSFSVQSHGVIITLVRFAFIFGLQELQSESGSEETIALTIQRRWFSESTFQFSYFLDGCLRYIIQEPLVPNPELHFLIVGRISPLDATAEDYIRTALYTLSFSSGPLAQATVIAEEAGVERMLSGQNGMALQGAKILSQIRVFLVRVFFS
ncbi:hypothetical protein BDP27DRAFT_1366102 [Rhodocollybia butyracea]|uniref:Uncharacterized protein n=1 Tax=Rhodocollybia butyracea TaxID=206335 RepID=A0A9P5U4D5_9AGAR|nr:hypothetical protein BDP27DRAFT_1366102 [Rhodocollybia butyracea]